MPTSLCDQFVCPCVLTSAKFNQLVLFKSEGHLRECDKVNLSYQEMTTLESYTTSYIINCRTIEVGR